MNSKTRVLTALDHREPDRVPTDLGGWVTTMSIKTYNQLLRHLEIDREGEVFDWLRQTVKPEEDVLRRLRVDTRYVHLGRPHGWRLEPIKTDRGLYVADEWGCGFLMPESSLYYNLIHSPLEDATIEDLDDYPWPDPDDPGYLDGIAERAQQLHEDGQYAVVGDFAWESWFERAWKLRSLDRFLMDTIVNRDFVHALLDRTVSLHRSLLCNVLDACGQYLDVVIQGGDFGTQDNTLISPDAYREFVKPRQETIVSVIKERTNAQVFWHSCGAVSSLIDDFIEVGIDILNPVQVSAKGMNVAELKARYGNRIVLWGGVDSQRVLPGRCTGDVERAVKRLLREAASGGGFVVCAVHNIQADVPAKNVVAMYDAVHQWGHY